MSKMMTAGTATIFSAMLPVSWNSFSTRSLLFAELRSQLSLSSMSSSSAPRHDTSMLRRVLLVFGLGRGVATQGDERALRFDLKKELFDDS